MDISMTWFADIKTFFIDRGTSASFKCLWILLLSTFFFFYVYLYNPTVRRLEALPGKGGGGGGSHVARLNFKTSRVSVINACCLLSALPSLSQFSRGRLSLVVISFYALAGPQVSLNSPGEKKPNLCYFREVCLHITYMLLGMLSWVLRLWAWSVRHARGRKRVK